MLAESMKDTILSSLIVGGYVAISFLVIDLCLELNIFEPIIFVMLKIFSFSGITKETISAFLCGILEVSKGVVELSKLQISKTVLSTLASFLIGFGGISIFMQAFTFLKDAKVSSKFYLFQKFTHAIFSSVLTFLLCLLLKI